MHSEDKTEIQSNLESPTFLKVKTGIVKSHLEIFSIFIEILVVNRRFYIHTINHISKSVGKYS